MKAIPAFLLGCVALCAASNALAADTPGSPVFTNKTRFRIPFRYDANEMSSLGAREVQLFVSSDLGAEWKLVARATPDQGKFEFEAPADGDYWFSVRTLDMQNKLHPGGEFTPGLKVTVDTTKPQLELSLRQAGAGEVELTWTADDRNIDVSSIQINTRQAGDADWRTLEGVSQSSGSVIWTVPVGGIVAVQGSIKDRAANVVTSESTLRITADEPELRHPSGQDLSQPIASNSRAKIATRSSHGPVISPRGTAGRVVTDQVENRPEIVQRRYPAAEQEQTIPQRAQAGQQAQQQPESQANQNAPAKGKDRIVNSLSFQIGYQVDDVGPSGVSSVDLFITPDGGKKWYRYGSDPDSETPFGVEVPRDGVYGFALRVRSGVGLVAAPPRAGDKPSIVVIVDTTAPVIELIPPQQGEGQDLNQVVINWKLDDANPAAKPVAVFYSRGPQGPWEPVSGWQENTGGYSWTLGQNMPPRFYVRVKARDAAGNISEVDATEPVVVDMTRPSARIVDVESNEAR